MFTIPNKPSIKQKDKKPDARMFAIVPIRAINDKTLSRGDFINLMLVCSYCSHGGYTTAALSTMASYRGIAPSTLCKALKRLEKKGYLQTVRGGYTGLRGSLKRVIFDDKLRLKDVVSIASAPIHEDIMKNTKHKTINKLKEPNGIKKAINSAISYDEAVLVVSHSLKTEADLLKLERLVASGVSHDALVAAFS